MYVCELVHTLHVGKDIYVSMSHYNRLFWVLPHQKILYSNNLINPVSTLDTRDDLIFKYSSTRINTVIVNLHNVLAVLSLKNIVFFLFFNILMLCLCLYSFNLVHKSHFPKYLVPQSRLLGLSCWKILVYI